MTMPWFRFYSEAIHDTKLRRVARKSGVSFAEALGTWAVILSYASESPQRGALLLSDGNPVTLDDIEDVTGCNVSETFQQLLCNGMLVQIDTLYHVTNWDKRQYASDNSTERVHKHREKARNASETPKKRYSSVSETPPDTDTDTDTESKKEEEKPSPTFADGSGYSAASRASKWNNQVSAALRTPIANVILDIIGKRLLVDTGSTLGDKVLDAAHENAITLYKLGYKTPESLLAIEPDWRKNWRGKDGGGTPEQLATFAAELKAGASSNGDTPKAFTVLYPDGTSKQVGNE